MFDTRERSGTIHAVSGGSLMIIIKILRFSVLPLLLLLALLQVAQDIALADGFLERGELRLLQDIYKALL